MPDIFTTRTAAGLSQSAAARLLGVSVRTVQGWETRRPDTLAHRLAVRLLAVLTADRMRLPPRP